MDQDSLLTHTLCFPISSYQKSGTDYEKSALDDSLLRRRNDRGKKPQKRTGFGQKPSLPKTLTLLKKERKHRQ